MQTAPNTDIILVDYPGVQASALLGLQDLFAAIPRLEPGITARPLRRLAVPDLPQAPAGAFIFCPSTEPTQAAPDHPAALWAQQQHAQGALACSVCAGAFWLGHAGLLDGRPATTHWGLEPAFREAFPQVDLQPEHMLVDDGDVITAGGLMAWVDLGLHLAGLWYGSEIVSRLCRYLLVDPPGREQRHYSSFRPLRGHGDLAVLRLQRHLDQHLQDRITVPQMAEIAGLSARSFLRRFQAATGMAPAGYLQALRIERARGTLERSTASIAETAWACGYQDVPAFVRAFRSITGLPPGAYRDRFRISSRTAPAAAPLR